MKWGQCALTHHFKKVMKLLSWLHQNVHLHPPIFGRDLCLKCVPEVAGGNNLTNRPLVGRNTKRFSDYPLNLFVL